MMFHRHPLIDSTVDYSQRKDIAYVIENRKFYISEVFHNIEGKLAFSLSQPVFRGSKFVGIVRITEFLGNLTKNYINPLLQENIKVYFLDDTGKYIYPHPSNNTKTVSETLQERKIKNTQIDYSSCELMQKKRAKGEKDVVTFEQLNSDNNIEKVILAYHPVTMGDRVFSISVCTDYDKELLPAKQYTQTLLSSTSLR